MQAGRFPVPLRGMGSVRLVAASKTRRQGDKSERRLPWRCRHASAGRSAQGEGGFMDASVVGENQPSVAQLFAVRGGEGTFP